MNIKKKDNSINAKKTRTEKSVMITVTDEFGNQASKLLTFKAVSKFINVLKRLIGK